MSPSGAKGAGARPGSARMKELSKGSSPARNGSPASKGGATRSSGSGSKQYAFNTKAIDRSNETPAPGAYDTDAHSLAGQLRKTHNKMIAQGRGTFMSKLNEDRSAQSLTEDGDPTLYSDYHLEKMSLGKIHTYNKLVSAGTIPFGTNTGRTDADFEDRSPLRGPGSYDYHHLYGCGVMHGVGGKGTTAFTNSAPLLGFHRNIETPGAGAYEPKTIHGNGGFSNQGTSSFTGNTARCAEHITSAGTAGPETYDLDHQSIARAIVAKINPRLPPFDVSSRRL